MALTLEKASLCFGKGSRSAGSKGYRQPSRWLEMVEAAVLLALCLGKSTTLILVVSQVKKKKRGRRRRRNRIGRLALSGPNLEKVALSEIEKLQVFEVGS